MFIAHAQKENDHPQITPITQTSLKKAEEKCDLDNFEIKNRCNPRNLWTVFSELRGILQVTQENKKLLTCYAEIYIEAERSTSQVSEP
jgi:hypothetical protein